MSNLDKNDYNMKRYSPDEESDSPDSKRKKKEKTSEGLSGDMSLTSDTCYITRELAENLKNSSKKIMLAVLHMTDIVNNVEQPGLKEQFIKNATLLSTLFLENGHNLGEGHDTDLGGLISFAYKMIKILKDVRQSWTALSMYNHLNQHLTFLEFINTGREQLCFILKNLNKNVLFKNISESTTPELSEASIVTEAKSSFLTKTDIMHHSSSFKQGRKRSYSKNSIDSTGERQMKKRKKNSEALKNKCIKYMKDSIAGKQKKKRKKISEMKKGICNRDVKLASAETKKNKKKKKEVKDQFLSGLPRSVRTSFIGGDSYTTTELAQNFKVNQGTLNQSKYPRCIKISLLMPEYWMTSSKTMTLVLLNMIETVNCLHQSGFKEDFISNTNVYQTLFLLMADNLTEKTDADLKSLINVGHELIKIATLVKDKWILLARYLPLDQYMRFHQMISMQKKELNSILENMNKKFSSERIGKLHSTRKHMPKEVVNIQATQNNATKSDIMHPSLNQKQNDDTNMGEKKKTNIYPLKVPDCLMDSSPHLHHDCFIYVIQMNLIEPLQKERNPFNYPIKDPADSNIDVGILLSKSLPKINSFPIFTKIGKIRIDLFTDEESASLTDEELNLAKKYHEFICSDIFDVTMDLIPEIPFYIVPVKKGDDTACIDFDSIKASLSHPHHDLKSSTDISTSQPEISHKDTVFMKTYKSHRSNNIKKTFHHFVRCAEICVTSMSTIPGYNSYEAYYKQKYGIKLKNKKQKLIETFSNTVFSSHKPIYRSFNEKWVNSRTSPNGLETFKNYREFLLLELCYRYPIKSSLLQKIQCIPVIMYRIYCLLLAEDLRRSIFGFILDKEYRWSYFDISKPGENITDIFSSIGFSQHSFHNPPAYDILKNNQNFISFCKITENFYGPSPGNILEAITLAKANDAFDLERYEIIGDSFLKYVISLKLFIEHKESNSKHLSNMRNVTIKNEYLYKKACEKRIPIYLIVNEFHEKATIPTCFIKNLTTQTELNRIMSLKKIADSVESLIGSCLINSGQSAAIIFMQYIGLDPFPKKIEISTDMIYKWPAILTKNIEIRQKTIDEYKNQNLMQRAVRNILTMGQIKLNRISYLGNAILGYLLTRYFYEDERNLKPGEITLLRNKLINNNLYASLSLKYKLEETVKSMQVQRMKQKVADFRSSEYFRFILAKGYPSEDLEFPEDCRYIVRTLSDVFQGLAAIIYMENNCSLDAVWHEYEKMLQEALEYYLGNIRLSTQDDLEQVLKTTDAFTQIYHGGDNWHILLLLPNGTVITTKAPQLKTAKTLAAKKALERMKKQKDEI